MFKLNDLPVRIEVISRPFRYDLSSYKHNKFHIYAAFWLILVVH